MSFIVKENVSSKASRNFYCGSCNLQFFIKDIALKGSRCPMLLNCGHSMCESCIQKNLRVMKVITCQLCGSFQAADQTIECFSLSMYVVGNLISHQNTKQGKDIRTLMNKYGNFNYSVKESGELNLKPDLSGAVCEECSLKALWYCGNCKSNFCEICWSTVHGSARSLMRHCKTSITNAETARTRKRKCPEHDSQDLEFYCKGCCTTICSHCVILQHQGEGHCPITLKEKNVEMMSSVRTVAEEAEKITKRMKNTLEKIKLTQSSSESSDSSFLDLKRQITSNFSRVHGILQLEEERLLKILHENWNNRENCIQALRVQLEDQIENVESLLGQYEMVAKNPQDCDASDLHIKLKDVQNLPCYLISENPCDKEAKVTFDEGMIESVKNYCKMDLPSTEIFALRSSSNLPEGYAVEPLSVPDSEENVSYAGKSEKEFSVSDVDTFSSCSSRDLVKQDVEFPLMKATNGPMVFQEKKNYSVRVSYIKNPGEFYVTLNSQRSKKQAIDKRASHYVNSSVIPTSVTKGEIYLVKYNVDKKWYRARVNEVFLPKEDGGEKQLQVYYLDYGNTETVPISRLRFIREDMLEPPLAVKCKLFDCVPKGGEWCLESTKTMEKILNNCTATMFVMKVHNNCLEVDLSVIYPDGQIGRDIVSVRDALLFLDFSSFVHGPETHRSVSAMKYLQQCFPSIGESFHVVVTHVVSPSDFYVQNVAQDISYLSKMTIDLQRYYSEKTQKGLIYNPAVGMPCAALFPSDKKWYRAKIIDIPGKKMVSVFYVDYGNKETLPWTSIRKLREHFVKWPALALNCSLAGVLPVDGLWNVQSKSYMGNCVMTKGCRVRVHGWPKSKQKLRVFLYTVENSKEVCVNNLLVEIGCAVKTAPDCLWNQKAGEEHGSISENFKTNKHRQGKADGNEDGDHMTSGGEKEFLKRSRTFQDRSRNKLSAKKLRELHETEKKNGDEGSSGDDAENETDEFDNVFKIKVEILSAESPSCIYVTFPALMDEFNHLQSKLNEFYQYSSQQVPVDWTPGSACAVHNSAKDSWFRGSVLSILPSNQVKVFLKDVAQVCTEPKSALRELEPSFTKYATCAVKCHLADVRPPGQEWPSISSEYLLSEIEKFKEIYMTKRGQIDNKSLPVELWVQRIVPRGALEPNTKEWVTLNRLLVNQGLAIPLQQKMWCSSVPSNDEDHSDHMDESKSDEQTEGFEDSSEKENKKEENVSDTFIPSLSSLWLSPQPLEKSRFVGMPTYVDFNAFIHIYDIEQDEGKLKVIREALVKEYGNSRPNSEDHFWSPGQLCIARYHVDDSWYRGKIIQINEDLTYEVLFVDYGNVETCQVPDLRKGIKMQEIPIVSRRFQLQGIAPISEDGKWPVAVIDVLHSLVVDKMCVVNVLKPSLDPSGSHVISLKVIENDIEVGTFLVDQGLASLSCSMSDSWNESELNAPSSNKDISFGSPQHGVDFYIPLNIPDDGGGFFIKVTIIHSETEFFGNIAMDESMTSSLKKVLNEFENLQKILTDECHLQPRLQQLTKGQPCCSFQQRHNRWSRGEIESCINEDDSVCVFYVDSGEKEIVHKDSLHECKSEWLTLPKMAMKFRLANVEKCPDVSKSVYMKALSSCLKQSLLFAEIIGELEEVLEVRLLTNKRGRLVYQEMIDKKFMTFTV